MKNPKLIVNILAILGLIFGILGFILSFTPLGTIPVIPALLGLILGLIGLWIMRRADLKKKVVYAAVIISALAIVISVITGVLIENKVAEDTEFEQTIEESEDEVLEELEELEDIE